MGHGERGGEQKAMVAMVKKRIIATIATKYYF
jgi:hypothetical protein